MKNRILIAGIMLVFLACNAEVDKVEKTSISEQGKKENDYPYLYLNSFL